MTILSRTLPRAVFRTRPGHWDPCFTLLRLFTSTPFNSESNVEGRLFDTVAVHPCRGTVIEGKPSVWWHGYIEKEGERGDEDFRLGKVVKEEKKVVGAPKPGLPRLVRHWRMEKEEGAENEELVDGVVKQVEGAGEGTTLAEKDIIQQQLIRDFIETKNEESLEDTPNELPTDTPKPKSGRTAKPEKLQKFQRLRYEKADRKGHLSLSKSPRSGSLSKAEQQRLAEIERREAERQEYFQAKLERERQKRFIDRVKADKKKTEERNEDDSRVKMREEKRKAKKEKKRERYETRKEERMDPKNLGDVEG